VKGWLIGRCACVGDWREREYVKTEVVREKCAIGYWMLLVKYCSTFSSIFISDAIIGDHIK